MQQEWRHRERDTPAAQGMREFLERVVADARLRRAPDLSAPDALSEAARAGAIRPRLASERPAAALEPNLVAYVATWRTNDGDPIEGEGLMLHPDRETAEAHEAHGAGRAEPLARPLWDFIDWPPEFDCPTCSGSPQGLELCIGMLPVATSSTPMLACPSCDATVAAKRESLA